MAGIPRGAKGAAVYQSGQAVLPRAAPLHRAPRALYRAREGPIAGPIALARSASTTIHCSAEVRSGCNGDPFDDQPRWANISPLAGSVPQARAAHATQLGVWRQLRGLAVSRDPLHVR